MRNRCLVSTLLLACGSASAQTIDLAPDNGRRDAVTPDAVSWIIKEGPASSLVVGEVTLTLASTDGPLKPFLWKGGIDTGATLACDGVRGKSLSLTLTGLSDGAHTITLFHATGEKQPEPGLAIHVNDSEMRTHERIPARVAHDLDAAISHVHVIAVDGTVSLDLLAGDRDAVLNAIAIDVPDPTKQASRPHPAHRDEHIDPTGEFRWTSPVEGASFDVYFGTDEAVVRSADRNSPAFKGTQSTTTFAPGALGPATSYFWRVDSTHDNITTPGNIWRCRPRALAFPGAEGYGRFARGGRGGRVLYVTSLDDSGPGTLREAVDAVGPRTIVFRVGGTIHLKDRLVIKNPYCTVAGQTAPGDGIAVRGAAFGMGGTHDVIMRYVRLRVGDESGKTWDGMGMAGSDHCIIDHCSIAWSIDEGVSSRGAKNITFQRNIIAEPLNMSVHEKYKGTGKGHGYAGSISGNVGSFHHNLIAHAAGRNWSLAGGLTQGGKFAGYLDLRNNVVYNWVGRTNDGGVRMANIVGNYYIPGPATKVHHLAIAKMELRLPDDVQEYYISDNVMEGKDYDADNWQNGGVVVDANDIGDMKLTEPFCPSFITQRTARSAYDSVMNDVGANFPRYDSVDERAISDTLNRTHTFKGSKTGLPGIPDSQTDVGGYPELKGGEPYPDADADGMDDRWEAKQNLDPTNPDDRNETDKDGWTNLERFLNGLVAR
jgi:hypothetical protein